jgi:parallel beta-helix repeat protein
VVEGNEMAGGGIVVSGSAPSIRGNTLRGSGRFGVDLTGGAGGVVEDNVIEGSACAGVRVSGSAPSVLRNRISGGRESGVLVEDGGAGEVADCEVVSNAFCGVRVVGRGSAPAVRGNRIAQNGFAGIEVAGARGRVTGNEIFGNGGAGVHFDGVPEAGLEVSGNRVAGNRAGPLGGVVVDGPLGANELGVIALFAGPARGIAEAIEAGRIGAADELCVMAIRQAAGRAAIDSPEAAALVPPEMLTAMDAVWGSATGAPLRARPWVGDPAYGVSAPARGGGTFLAKRLAALRL